jgi:hypothetical protein
MTNESLNFAYHQVKAKSEELPVVYEAEQTVSRNLLGLPFAIEYLGFQ